MLPFLHAHMISCATSPACPPSQPAPLASLISHHPSTLTCCMSSIEDTRPYTPRREAPSASSIRRPSSQAPQFTPHAMVHGQ
mmetsp:Transcript_5221/g.11020  ORF Transcript_5221/g.11020 Transcript_5221/m.11020 type:complete len:82 (-) Transcript_5221:1468-1713(-)